MDGGAEQGNGGFDRAFVRPAAAGGRLPYVLRIVRENLIRHCLPAKAGSRSGLLPSQEHDQALIAAVENWRPGDAPFTVPMAVTRLILPDSSGLPSLIDLAALRAALVREGIAPGVAEPVVPVDLVVDHSLIVEEAGHGGAAARNVARDFQRNAERYAMLKWAQQAFGALRVVPPGMGIIHQVHLEKLARVVADADGWAFPEFVLGGDSHTPMAGAIGILGWGIGGIEAEAVMLGQPYPVRVGAVTGVRLTGRLRPGVTATDLALTLTERLRREGVVGQFVEYVGEGAAALPVADRATIANMAPEYGATCGYFPIDAATLAYLRQTGREAAHVALVEDYAKAAGLWREADDPEPAYTRLVMLDLAEVEASVAGPRRPQDRMPLGAVAADFRERLSKPAGEGGFDGARHPGGGRGLGDEGAASAAEMPASAGMTAFRDGALAIAAITSCTNTANPGLMLGAGLLARNAVARGLRVPPWIKTSLAPGSRVVARYLADAGLMAPLEALGFHVVGYGCTTCSGKSGPLKPAMAAAIERDGIVAAAILSGNRNFEGRIHRLVRANYLASPMLVVAYALAGRIDIDLATEPLGHADDGAPVHLRDIWPDHVDGAHDPALYRENYAALFAGTERWRALPARSGPLFPFDPASSYIVEPPFLGLARPIPDRIAAARVLGRFADSLTTDHISPAGEIPADGAAGHYLASLGIEPRDFNAFTMRRGNHEVMLRGTFANPRIVNLLAPDHPGGLTRHWPNGDILPMHEAAARYRAAGTPALILGGKDYGMGSSRDWAAKGTALLGVRAVFAESFERIHRANLVALGVLPLVYEGWATLGLDGSETYDLTGLDSETVAVTATAGDGRVVRFTARPALETAAEAECLRAGGMFAVIHRALSKPLPFRNSGSIDPPDRSETAGGSFTQNWVGVGTAESGRSA